MAWRPIKTAPKDGTRIDLWIDWDHVGGMRETDAYWAYGDWQVCISDLDGAEPLNNMGIATHWMRPPKAPK